MKRQYQLPEHVRVISARDGIVEVESSDFSDELMDRLDVMTNRLAEELDLPGELVHARLRGTVDELVVMTLFNGTRDVTTTVAQKRLD
jgi:hypothetical protein